MWEDPNRIRELRLARSWSQQRLADLIGVSKVTISDLERGKMALTVDYMRRLAGALSQEGGPVSPAEILTADDNPYLPTTDERELLEHYRSADGAHREIIKRVAAPTTVEAEDAEKAA